MMPLYFKGKRCPTLNPIYHETMLIDKRYCKLNPTGTYKPWFHIFSYIKFIHWLCISEHGECWEVISASQAGKERLHALQRGPEEGDREFGWERERLRVFYAVSRTGRRCTSKKKRLNGVSWVDLGTSSCLKYTLFLMCTTAAYHVATCCSSS